MKGVWLYPAAPAPKLVDAVVRAEEIGLDEIWIADEGIARDPMAVLAAAAPKTSTIQLAVGVTSPLLRHAGAIAATAATVDELSGGRFLLGLGVGGDRALAPFRLRTDRPVAVVRDAVLTARDVLQLMGREAVPIWVGARGPQLVRLAARRADGVFVSGCTAEQHDTIVAEARAVDATTSIALYQSASDANPGPTASTWDAVGPVLAAEAERISPTSIGINLVELIDAKADPVAAVERAAAVLSSLG